MEIHLPSLGFSLRKWMDNDVNGVIMILGGRRPSSPLMGDLASLGWDLWAVDRGLGYCRRSGMIPRVAIGDMDSASPSDLKWASDLGIAMDLHSRDKDLTDFQLALKLLAGSYHPHRRIMVTGCFGGRFDHLMSSVMTFAHSDLNAMGMVDHREAIFVLRGDEQLEMLFHRGAPKAISLLPVTRSRGVTTQGLKWELSGAELEPSFPFSVSNEARSDRIHVGLEKGILLVYVTRG